MKAVLLSAGTGTRLRPITLSTPKCMVPVLGRPLIAYWLDLLFPACERVLINTHYLPDPVRSFVAGSPWADRIDLIHEATLLGTGGTLLANRRYLEDGTFLVAHSDNLSCFDLASFLEHHWERPPAALLTMMTFRTDSPKSCGIVELAPNGMVKAFQEKPSKPTSNLANGAVYLFEPQILEFMFSLGKPLLDLSLDVIPRLTNRITAWENTGYHRDIGTPESLLRAGIEYQSFLNARQQTNPTP